MDEQLYISSIGMSEQDEMDALYEQARHIPLSVKLQASIKSFQAFEPEALKKDHRGYRIGMSWGKDSIATQEVAVMAGVKFFSVHNHTTLDPIELLRFGRKHYPDTIIERPEKALLHLLAYERTTIPTRRARWCCDVYKERKSGCVNAFGIRAFESRRRRRSWKIWTPHIKTGDWTLNPILYWTDDDVWQFIRERKLPYCELYDQGFTRIGCIGCPLNPSSQKREFERYPGYEKAWKWAITKFWERLHDAKKQDGQYYYWHKFDTPEALWNWWMMIVETEEPDDCQMGLF